MSNDRAVQQLIKQRQDYASNLLTAILDDVESKKRLGIYVDDYEADGSNPITSIYSALRDLREKKHQNLWMDKNFLNKVLPYAFGAYYNRYLDPRAYKHRLKKNSLLATYLKRKDITQESLVNKARSAFQRNIQQVCQKHHSSCLVKFAENEKNYFSDNMHNTVIGTLGKRSQLYFFQRFIQWATNKPEPNTEIDTYGRGQLRELGITRTPYFFVGKLHRSAIAITNLMASKQVPFHDNDLALADQIRGKLQQRQRTSWYKLWPNPNNQLELEPEELNFLKNLGLGSPPSVFGRAQFLTDFNNRMAAVDNFSKKLKESSASTVNYQQISVEQKDIKDLAPRNDRRLSAMYKKKRRQEVVEAANIVHLIEPVINLSEKEELAELSAQLVTIKQVKEHYNKLLDQLDEQGLDTVAVVSKAEQLIKQKHNIALVSSLDDSLLNYLSKRKYAIEQKIVTKKFNSPVENMDFNDEHDLYETIVHKQETSKSQPTSSPSSPSAKFEEVSDELWDEIDKEMYGNSEKQGVDSSQDSSMSSPKVGANRKR